MLKVISGPNLCHCIEMETSRYTTDEILTMPSEWMPVFHRELGLSATANRRDIFEDLARRGMIRDMPSPVPVVPGFTYHHIETYQASLFETTHDIPRAIITGKTLVQLADNLMTALVKLRPFTDTPWLFDEQAKAREHLKEQILAGNFESYPELLSAYRIEYKLLRGRGPVYRIAPETVGKDLLVFETL